MFSTRTAAKDFCDQKHKLIAKGEFLPAAKRRVGVHGQVARYVRDRTAFSTLWLYPRGELVCLPWLGPGRLQTFKQNVRIAVSNCDGH